MLDAIVQVTLTGEEEYQKKEIAPADRVVVAAKSAAWALVRLSGEGHRRHSVGRKAVVAG